MKKTVAYYRSSTSLQEDSVDAQQYRIKQYALKHQLLIDDEYAEKAVSARKNKLLERPEMKRLISDINKGNIERIIVYKRDRLARKVEEHLQLYQLFKKKNVEVILIAENEPPMRFDIFGELMELFIGVMNQREGEQINARILDTKIDNFLQGKSIGNLPYGYKANELKTEIIRLEDELNTVKFIFGEWNTDQYKNTQELAKELKKRGIKRNGKAWTGNNITDLLNNPIYMGTRVATFDSRSFSRSVKDLSVISPEDYRKARELLNKRKPVKKETKTILYLLNELLYCEVCKKKLIESHRTKEGEKVPTYECKEHGVKFNQIETEKAVYERTKDFFQQLLESNFHELFRLHEKKHVSEINKLQQNFEHELERLEQKLIFSISKWIKSESEKNKEKVLSVNQEINTCRTKLLDLEEKKQKLLSIPDDVERVKNIFFSNLNWERLSYENKKDLFHDLIHSIYAGEHSLRIVFKHPYLESDEVIR